MAKRAFDDLKAGLERAIAHAEGTIRLDSDTVRLPDTPPPMSPSEIARLRSVRLGLSQRAFAKVINAAPQTVQAWEQGRTTPSGCALRFLELLQRRPDILDELIESKSA